MVEAWQTTQSSVVTTWPAFFPGALEPSWQPAQVPVGEGLLCAKLAGIHDLEVWQSSQ